MHPFGSIYDTKYHRNVGVISILHFHQRLKMRRYKKVEVTSYILESDELSPDRLRESQMSGHV